MIRRLRAWIAPAIITAWGLTVPAVRADVSLLVSSLDTASVLRYDGQTGHFLQAFVPPGSGGLVLPFGLIYGPDNNLYVTDVGTHSVLRYDGRTGAPRPARGQTGAVFVPSGSGGLGFDFSLAFGPNGDLYVSSSDNDAVFRFDGKSGVPRPARGQTGAVFVPSGSGGLSRPTDLVFGPDGALYVSSTGADAPAVVPPAVLRFDGKTGAPRPAPGQPGAVFIPAGSGGLIEPKGLLFRGDGALYVADYQRSAVMRYDETTGAFLDVFVPPNAGGLTAATGLQIGPDDNLYVTGGPDEPVIRFDGQTGEFLNVFVAQGSGGLVRPVFARFSSLPGTGLMPMPHAGRAAPAGGGRR